MSLELFLILMEFFCSKPISLICEVDETGRTVLHWASSGGHTNLVQWLIEHQASVDTRDDSNWTPLIIAASAGHEAVVRLLIGAGADVNCCTDQVGEIQKLCVSVEQKK